MADSLDGLLVGLQNYVVAPLNAFGLGGFVFDVQGEGRAQLRAEITDHYTEDNKSVQDHIARRPKRITLSGYVGELVYRSDDNRGQSILQEVTQKLTVISAFLPKISAAATQGQAALADPTNSSLTLNSLADALPGAANIYGLVKNTLGAVGTQASQQNAYNYLSACFEQGILMGVQTPWEFLTNMAIESIDATQSEDSAYISDFTVTYKQIRIVASQTAATLLSGTGGTPAPGGVVASTFTAQQGAAVANQGIVPGVGLPTSLLSGIQSQITDVHSLSSIPGLSSLFRLN